MGGADLGEKVAKRQSADTALRGAVRIVALLNLGYFGIEFAVAVAIGSVSLFADSIDFLEDASVNFLIGLPTKVRFSRRRWQNARAARASRHNETQER